MRGQLLLVIGFLFVMIVVSMTVYLLRTLAELSGGTVFLLTALIGVLTSVVYVFVATKLGY